MNPDTNDIDLEVSDEDVESIDNYNDALKKLKRYDTSLAYCGEPWATKTKYNYAKKKKALKKTKMSRKINRRKK